MTDAIALLWPPFLVALCLIGIHTYFGIQVLARNVIFVDLALAQIAALGTTMAFMLGHPTQGSATYLYSLAFTLLAAFLLAFTRNWSRRISQEALIGVIYVVAAAAAILLIDRAPQGAEHLKQILTGNILVTGMAEVATIVPIYLAIGALHWVLRHRLAASGEQSWLWEFVFYATFGVVVTSSVALAGVLLVFSFLIMPAAVGVLFADTLRRQLAIGWTVGTLASAVGLAASYGGDLPTGATMVCTFGATLALAGLIYVLRQGQFSRVTASCGARRPLGCRVDPACICDPAHGGAAGRSSGARFTGISFFAPPAGLFHEKRGSHLPGCRRLRRALPSRGRAVERAGNPQPRRRPAARRPGGAKNLLVHQVLHRDAQRRGIRAARGALAGARAHPLAGGRSDAAHRLCDCAGTGDMVPEGDQTKPLIV